MTKRPPTDLRQPAAKHQMRTHLIAAAVLAAIVLGIFADVLIDPDPVVVGYRWSDLTKQFVAWRMFGFDELAKGNLALWNPHIFSGCPYFGGMQSALLYPPNWLFMIVPIVAALNLSIALHLYLAGVGMYAWARHRGLETVPATAAGAVLMLCGPVFMQIHPGHLPHLCTMAWAPLVLLAIDGLIDRPSVGWVLLGSLAVAMQVLAGHPQYFFYTAVAAGIYALFNLLLAKRRLLAVAGIVAVFAVAAAVTSVQWLTTLSEAGETLRSGGASFEDAKTFSFPPENFVCFLAPTFFGGAGGVTYWGRWFLWEVQPFIGLAGLLLAIYGAFTGPPAKRRFSVAVIAVMLLLAMGSYVPQLFRLTYEYVPGFNRFRNSCRFLYPAALFLAMLCGVGLESLVRERRYCRAMAGAGMALAVVLAITGWIVSAYAKTSGGGELWGDVLAAVKDTKESCSFPWFKVNIDSEIIHRTGVLAAESLLIAAATACAVALVLILAKRFRRVGYVAVVLVVAELFVFARFTQRPTFRCDEIVPAKILEHVGEVGREGMRTLSAEKPDMAMVVGGRDMWGYDSFVLRRYIELMFLTQGYPISSAWGFQAIEEFQPHPLFAMLRCRSMLVVQSDPVTKMVVHSTLLFEGALSHLQLVGQYYVIPGRDNMLAALNSPDFDPRRMVLLESEPAITPGGVSGAGWAKVVDSSTDEMTIEAELQSPAILLITDAYSKHWRAEALPGSSQDSYTVMPANHTLRAIPMSAGHHRLRMFYSPWGYRVGQWISLGAVLAYLAAAVAYLVYRLRMPKPSPPVPERKKVTYVNPRVVHRD